MAAIAKCWWFYALLASGTLLASCMENRSQVKAIKSKSFLRFVAAEETWRGDVSRMLIENLEQAVCIATSEEWSRWWKLLRPSEPAPPIAFDDWLVVLVINTEGGPFDVSLSRNREADLLYAISRTPEQVAQPGMSSYLFARIRRDGIRSFQSKSIVPRECRD